MLRAVSFFCNDTATTEIYTLSLHDALPISSASLSSSLDYRATLASVANLAVPYLADWCAIDILEEDGSLNRLALTHQEPEKVALAQELEERHPSDPEAQHGVSQVLRTGQPELVPEITESLLDEAVRDTRHREI